MIEFCESNQANDVEHVHADKSLYIYIGVCNFSSFEAAQAGDPVRFNTTEKPDQVPN